jgi:hypothetical protein
MFTEYQVVKLKRQQANLPAGALGAILMVYDSVPRGYDVEFTDCNGVTLALLTLRDDDLEAVP